MDKHKKQEYNKKYRELNGDRINAQKRKRYAENREQMLINRRKYYTENREKILSSQRQRWETDKLNRLRHYKNGCLERGMLWDLEDQYAMSLMDKECYYCGHIVIGKINGIDRVLNHVGYIKENCVPCCSECNMIKYKHPYEKFMKQVKKIASKHLQ